MFFIYNFGIDRPIGGLKSSPLSMLVRKGGQVHLFQWSYHYCPRDSSKLANKLWHFSQGLRKDLAALVE